jgi:hypothetical protein
MIRLYVDEDFPGEVVQALRNLGYDILTAHEAGRANRKIPDADQLAFATSRGRAVLTYNRRHYIRLHSRVRPHAGILVCTHDPNRLAQAQKIHQALLNVPTLDNQLLRIHKS